MCQRASARSTRHGQLLLLLRDARRRLRRAARKRRPGRRPGARPEHRERADRGDRAQLPGAHRAPRARRGLRGPGPVPRRARAAPRLPMLTSRRRSRSWPTVTGTARGARSAAATRPVAEYVLIRDGVETRLGSKTTARARRGRHRSASAAAAAAATGRRRSATRRACCATSWKGRSAPSGRATTTGSRSRIATLDERPPPS